MSPVPPIVTSPLKTYRVTVEGELGCVDVPLAHAVPGA
jgi:hypothetical protein